MHKNIHFRYYFVMAALTSLAVDYNPIRVQPSMWKWDAQREVNKHIIQL